MDAHFVLPSVVPTSVTSPSLCPTCGGTHFRLHQHVPKPLKDAVYQQITVARYKCLGCGHTFRVYPQGVTHAHTSQRVQDVAVVLYLLGLSYSAVSVALDALGVYLCKSRVYDAVQTAKTCCPHLLRVNMFAAIRRQHAQAAPLLVQCMDHWLPLALIAHDHTHLVLNLDPLPPPDIALLQADAHTLLIALGGCVLITDSPNFERA